jgi:hypothetical protein
LCDLVVSNIFLFPKMKTCLKEGWAALKGIFKEDFQNCFCHCSTLVEVFICGWRILWRAEQLFFLVSPGTCRFDIIDYQNLKLLEINLKFCTVTMLIIFNIQKNVQYKCYGFAWFVTIPNYICIATAVRKVLL